MFSLSQIRIPIHGYFLIYSRGVQTGVATATQGQATMFTTTDSMGSSAAEAKLLSYLDASPSTSKVKIKFKQRKTMNLVNN